MSQRPVPPRGMRDLLPEEVLQRRHLLGCILPVYERYGFVQIETPLTEEIDRLLGSEGGENEKLIYKVLKRRLDWPPKTETEAVDLGLRFDLTVPLARFFATHSNELLMPFKSIQTGSVFRAERPQKGRYRQFTQCDIDIIGEQGINAEVELLCATSEALQACDVGEFSIRLNDRRLLESIVESTGFTKEQMATVLIILDKVDKIGIDGVAGELVNIDENSAKNMADLLEQFSAANGIDEVLKVVSFVDDEVINSIQTIITTVSSILPWVKVDLDATIVRGMGYYTGSIFEIEHPASSGSLGGGGRYDRMVGKLSGIDAPACGFSIGFERLWDVMASRIDTTAGKRRIVLLYTSDVSLFDINKSAHQLRINGDIVRTEVAAKNRSAQLKRFTGAGFTHWAESKLNSEIDIKPLEGK